MTTTLLELDELLLENVGDWIQHKVTTELTTGTTLVSTHLPKYRATADRFNDFWVYMDDYLNIGTYRRVSDDDGTNTLTVLGAWLTDATTDGATNYATFRLNRHGSWSQRTLAINQAINEVYPRLHISVTNTELVTNNILPPFRWATSTTLDLYEETNMTSITKTTTGGKVRGQSPSALTAPSAAASLIYLDSDDYPPLLDLMNKTVSLYTWVYPEDNTGDPDATLTIYTKKTTSTGYEEQTLTSTTDTPALYWTLVKLENQTLNDDLIQVIIKLEQATDAKYAYWMPPRLVQWGVYDYLLPSDFDDGNISKVFIQSGYYADYPCDDLQPRTWEPVYGFEIIEKVVETTTYKYLRLPKLYDDNRQIKLVGDKPFTAFTSATTSGSETIALDGYRLDLLVKYASYRLFKILQSGVSSEDRLFYEAEATRHLMDYYRLLRTHAMPRKAGTMKI